MKRTILLLLGFLLISSARADYLEVRHGANLYAESSKNSAILQHVDSGALLVLLSETREHGYYKIKVPATGDVGWIYGSLVQGHHGDIPEQQRTTQALHLGGEPLTTGSGPALAWAARHLALGKPVEVEERVREGYALGCDSRL